MLIVFLDFHFYNASDAILNVVNRSVARTLVGDKLCYDENWLRASLQTTLNTGKICLDLQRFPALLRPLAYYFLGSRIKLNESYETAQKLLSGVIRSRKRQGNNTDILQWLMDSYKGKDFDDSFLTNQILFVAIASTRSTATSIVNTLYDMLAYPQYQQPLRDEIRQVLKEYRGWSLSAMQKMKRLDSFIKESQRLNHHLLRK